MSLFRNWVYLAVTLGHFTIDVFNSSGPVLVTFLSVPLGLTAAQIGLAIGAYQLFSSISQPLFGWLADKIGSQWLGPGSVGWTIGFVAIAVVVAQQTNNFGLFMIFFVIGSLGSGAFHPLGTKHAAEESAERAATGTAIFFLFGQSGLASGPVLMGLILGSVGLIGVYTLAALSIPLVLFMVVAMRQTHIEPIIPQLDPNISKETLKKQVRWGAITLLAVLLGLRSWAGIGTVSFLPKMFQDMGWNPTAYGSITGAYWMSSAILGVLAGNWADRWGRRQVTFVTLVAGSVALYFLPLYDNWVAFILAILTGGLLGATHSILVVIAQALLPGKKAFASGVTLGYLFGVGAIAAWGIGWLADTWTLPVVIQGGAGLSLLAGLLAIFLPSTRETVPVQTEGVPA